MKHGAVASGHPETSGAAAEVLRAGGNAFDAAIAAILVSTVAEPVLSSLGGGGFMLARGAKGATQLVDFFSETPRTAADDADFYPISGDFGSTTQEFHIGMGSVAVPGLPAGLRAVHRRLATMPLRELAEPAIRLATDGLRVNRFQQSIMQILTPIVTANDEVRKLFVDEHGEMLQPGSLHFQPDIAEFMRAFAVEDERWFYCGEPASMIETMSRERGGHLSRADMEDYRVVSREPLSVGFGDAVIATNPPPSMGGTLIVHSIKCLERSGFSGGPLAPAIAHAVAATSHARRASRIQFDPTLDAAGRLLADEAIAEAMAEASRHYPARSQTTQISVIDGDGNVASTTLSNGEGSGCVLPGYGLQLNNFLGEEDLTPAGPGRWTPGSRLSSMMAPSIMQRGESLVALGSGGSNRLRTAILQVLVRSISCGQPLSEAISAPRVHFERGTLFVEPGLPDAELDELASTFADLHRFQSQSLFFGGVHAVQLGKDGLSGAADPRRGGVVLVV